MIGTNPSLESLAEALQAWIDDHAESHVALKSLPYEYADRYPPLRQLQSEWAAVSEYCAEP